ncbi:MAG: tetratricopeptide repeat protein [Flavobacteriales bacterium]|nr:tetratricopeptide repeat protein [Flavobacteriales bacterium]
MRYALLLLWLLPTLAQAQPPMDEQLAAQYFQQGDFERAALYYEKLYKKQPSAYYYEQLYKCYVPLLRYDEAEKLVKDQMRRGDDPRYPIDLGSLYKLMNEPAKAQQQYDKALKSLTGDQARVRQTANAFTRHNELDLALETYERGQKLMRDGTNFQYEIANLRAAKGDVPGMVRAYMDLLETNESYIQAVQNGLARSIDFSVKDERSETLRLELLRRIQRTPDKIIFQELLIWMYIQQKDLTGALVQSKALDKRMGEGGQRLMELATIALANNDPGTATKCYEYVVGLGLSPNLLQARMGLLKARFTELANTPEPPREALLDLDQRYHTAWNDLGRSRDMVGLLRDWAALRAYYLNDADGAIDLLQEAIDLPGLDNRLKNAIKLDLGDVYILAGDVWEASLLYSQVDLDMKHDVLGHEARLRNAKVSFYAGDLLWSKAQLDVLKASTSKLIANDAMELSLLITDNLGADSNSVPLGLFGQAQLLTLQHEYDGALRLLDSLYRAYPMHSLGDDVLYQRYRIAYSRHRYAEAATYLEKVIELYPNDILVDNALYDLGRLYQDKLNDKEKARGYFEKLLFEQSGSIFVPEARERFRFLRGDLDRELTPEEKFLFQNKP